MQRTNKFKYPSINGLRAISIVLVLIYHLNLKSHILSGISDIKWLHSIVYFIQDGHLGVNVFFVISGFLITSLLLQEEANSGKISIKYFYTRRMLRIFPAYYFLLLVYFLLQLFHVIHISNASWITSITYTKYFNWKFDWLTAHTWSLSVEEQFYLFWPLVFCCGKNFRKYITFGLLIIVPIIRIYISINPIDWINEWTFFTRIDAIATGCLFAFYKDTIIEKFKQYWTPIFYFSTCSLFFLRYFPLLAQKIGLEFLFIPLGKTHGTLANFLIAIIMLYSIFGPQKIWFRFLNLKAVNYIGILSYSIYLWQQLFISSSGFWMTQFPVNMVFIFLAAWFSYSFIEKPFLKMKETIAEKRKKF